MKRKLALSFLFMFSLAMATPVMSNTMTQEPEKKECQKKCDGEKKEKKDCDKKAEKKECDKEKK